MNASKHAVQRLQQRGIPKSAVRLLECVGTEYTQKGGCRVLYLNNRERKRIVKDLKRLLHCVAEERSPFIVLGDDDHVVTAGHLTKGPRKFRGY